MRKCLNLVTLREGFDCLEGLRVAAAAGFDSVGVWANTIEAQPAPLQYAAGLARECANLGIAIDEMCYVGDWMWAQGARRPEAYEVARRRAELAAAAGCPLVVACASDGTGDARQAADDFRVLCDIGAAMGVAFGLEYVGMFQQVRDLPSGLQIVREASHPSGKLLIDIFHTFRGGSTADDFALPKGHEIGLIHLNDVPAGDVSQMTDMDRVMPGDGVLPLPQIIGTLADIGFEGALSVEVFSAHWWAQPAESTARAAADRLKALMPA